MASHPPDQKPDTVKPARRPPKLAPRYLRQRTGIGRERVNGVLRDIASLTPLSFLQRTLTLKRGTLLRFERIRPEEGQDFAPNGHRETTPRFLENLIERAILTGFDIISLEEGLARISEPKRGRKFICLTFDGAYNDHFKHLLPIMRKFDLPFTIFTATHWPDGEGLIWWAALEEIIAKQDAVLLNLGDDTAYIASRTIDEKHRAFAIFENYVLQLDADERRAFCTELARLYGIDLAELCREQMMNWNELRRVSVSKKVSIGSLGLDHAVLDQRHLPKLEIEIRESQKIFEAQLGHRPKYYAYCDLGEQKITQATAKTVQGQGLQAAFTHRHGASGKNRSLGLYNLPRVSPTGKTQRYRYRDMLLAGALATLF